MHITGGNLECPSVTMFTESWITREAAQVDKLMLEHLLSNDTQYVTIGFDGGSTWCQASFLTVHATDQDGHAYFLDGVDTRSHKHSSQYYYEVI